MSAYCRNEEIHFAFKTLWAKLAPSEAARFVIIFFFFKFTACPKQNRFSADQ